MTRARQTYERMIAHVIPPELTGRDLKRARMLVLFATLGWFVSIGYTALNVAVGQIGLAFACAASVLVGPVGLLALRATRSIAVAGHIIVFGAVIAIAASTVGTGGVGGAVAAWNVLPPLLALMMIDLRAGILWGALTVAFVVILAVLESLGVALPNVDPGFEWAFTVINVVVLIIAVTAFAAFYHATLMRAHRALHEAGHREARLVLDHIGQGLATAGADGRLTGARSATFDAWFGAPASGARIWEAFQPIDPVFADWVELGWEAVFEQVLPIDVTIAQLPRELSFGDRHVELTYVPIEDDEGRLDRVLLVATDTSAAHAASERDLAHAEQLEAFRWIALDRGAFAAFVAEADRLVADLAVQPDRLSVASALHTLKGNAAVFGLARFGDACEDLEDVMDSGTASLDDVSAALAARWSDARALIAPLVDLGDDSARGTLRVTPAEHRAFLDAVRRRAPYPELAATAERWAWRPAQRPLDWLTAQARMINGRRGRGPIEVHIEGGDVRLPPARWQPFFAACIHLLRNAVAHAFEPPEVRRSLGKPTAGQLTLAALDLGRGVVAIEVVDDGAGIEWGAIEERVRALGLPFDSPDERLDGLFALGVSTARTVTDLSGRGVGLPTVRAACEALGGEVTVYSEPGVGTTFRFTFEHRGMSDHLRLSA